MTKRHIVVCPNCKSRDLSYYKEFCTTKYYKLNKSNIPTEKIEHSHTDDCNMPYGYQCNNCGELFGGTTCTTVEYEEIN